MLKGRKNQDHYLINKIINNKKKKSINKKFYIIK